MDAQRDREPVLTPPDPAPASSSLSDIDRYSTTESETLERDNGTAREATSPEGELPPFNPTSAAYHDAVRAQFRGQPDKCNQFLDLIIDCHAKE